MPNGEHRKRIQRIRKERVRLIAHRAGIGIDAPGVPYPAHSSIEAGKRLRGDLPAPKERWADPRAKLLSGEAWEAARPGVRRALGLPEDPDGCLAKLRQRLDEAYLRTAENLPDNDALKIGPNARGADALDNHGPR